MTTPVSILLVTLTTLSAAPSMTPLSQRLHVHLPRQIQIDGTIVRLGEICILRSDQDSSQNLSNLKLGQIFSNQQEFVVDRSMIASRLVSQGVKPNQITFTGAEKIMVQRRSQALSGEALTQQARSFLLERLPYLSHCVLESTRPIGDLSISQSSTQLRIEPLLLSEAQSSQLRVRLIIREGLTEIAKQDVIFQVRYRSGHLVATAPIAKGQPLTPDNVTIKESLANQPEEVVTQIPYGMITKIPVEPNSIIRPLCLEAPPSPILIKRNSNVVITVNLPGLRITAQGTLLSEGRSGEIVKVRNNDSRRVILCKVKPDGSVEPVL